MKKLFILSLLFLLPNICPAMNALNKTCTKFSRTYLSHVRLFQIMASRNGKRHYSTLYQPTIDRSEVTERRKTTKGIKATYEHTGEDLRIIRYVYQVNIPAADPLCETHEFLYLDHDSHVIKLEKEVFEQWGDEMSNEAQIQILSDYWAKHAQKKN